jgi:hypothetical protein
METNEKSPTWKHQICYIHSVFNSNVPNFFSFLENTFLWNLILSPLLRTMFQLHMYVIVPFAIA